VSFQDSINDGFSKVVKQDKIRANSLLNSSKQAIITARTIPLNKDSLKSIFRELYEGLRQQLEAIGYLKGYKFNSHECISYFISDILADKKAAIQFDRYRKLRNGINYYGDDIEETTVKEALRDIPILMKRLEKFCK
jgi:uncharacterized protein (UPF0332 family)